MYLVMDYYIVHSSGNVIASSIRYKYILHPVSTLYA